MESAECPDKLPHYSSKELLELLSIYEGELQARDALLELFQQQQQQQGISASSHSLDLLTSHCSSTVVLTNATSTGLHPQMGVVGEPFSALLRDSQLTDSEHAGECAMCGNALLRSAKIVQMQRMCERKMGKAIVLLGKRYTEVQQELGGRQRRMELMAVENGHYVKDLEAERDELLEQLTKCKTELAELFEQRVDVEDKLEGERERTRLMVLHLVEERKSMLAEARKQQQQQQQKEQEAQRVAAAITSRHHGSKSIDGAEPGDVHQQQIRRLSDENARLLSTVGGLQAEKAALKKRLDQLLLDLQQQNASNCLPQQQLHFLQSSKALSASKEQQQQQQQLITLRDNGLILCPPPHSLDKQPQHGHQRHQKQQQQQLFPPLPPSSSSISSSSSQHSFPTTTPPRPTIRPSSSFPLHLGTSPHNHSSSTSIDAGGGKQQRPTTAPEGNRRAKTITPAAVMGGIHRTHQFPVTESDWTTVDHRVVVPLMGTHSSSNFPRSSARTHPAPVPRTSVTTIARSPQQHRRTTMGGSIEQRVGGGQGQQQSQVAITRRSSSLPRRITVAGVPTTTTSAPPPQQLQQMPMPNSVRQQQQQQLQQRAVVIQHQQQKQPTSVTGSRHFFYQPSSALIGGDKYSNFL